MSTVVTIPFDFGSLPEDSRKSIVPICINKIDQEGNEIASGWFEAIVPIQDSLRTLARRRLADVWRVSELTELSVHKLWRNHRANFGYAPSRRIYKQAVWDAEDLRNDGYRNRRGLNISMSDLECSVRDLLLRDPTNYQTEFNNRLRLDEVRDWLKAQGREDMREILDLIARGHKWAEIADRMVEPEGNIKRRFSRWMARLRDAI